MIWDIYAILEKAKLWRQWTISNWEQVEVGEGWEGGT